MFQIVKSKIETKQQVQLHYQESAESIEMFCSSWRWHFVEKTNPQYLPKHWEIYKKEIYNFKEENQIQINN